MAQAKTVGKHVIALGIFCCFFVNVSSLVPIKPFLMIPTNSSTRFGTTKAPFSTITLITTTTTSTTPSTTTSTTSTTTPSTTTSTTSTTTSTTTTSTTTSATTSTSTTTTATRACPAPCSCRDISVYCNSSGLQEFNGEFPSGTLSIHLRNNSLNDVKSSWFAKCVSTLIYIDLSRNRLPLLMTDAYANARQLKALDLSHNKIRWSFARFFLGPSFSSLKDLLFISLSHNKLTLTTDAMFRDLTMLQTLLLDHNQLSTASLFNFRTLSGLRYLSLAGNAIKELDFAFHSSLTRLDIRDNLYSFNSSSKPFSYTPMLKFLEIGHPGLHYYPDTFTYLTELNQIHFEQYSQASLNGDVLAKIASTLQNLTVVRGNVFTIQVESMPNLKVLVLRYLDKLETLNLRNLPRLKLSSITVSNLDNLKSVKFEKLGLTDFQNPFQTTQLKIEKLSLNSNKLKDVTATTLSSLEYLTQLDVGFNLISGLNANTITKLKYLKELVLTGNLLARVGPNFLENPSLETLNLAQNFISFVSAEAFAQLPALKLVDLSSNQLTGVVQPKAPSLTQLVVQGNAWNCSCELYEQVKASTTLYCHAELAKVDCIVCTSPATYLGKHLGALRGVCGDNKTSSPNGGKSTDFVIPLVVVGCLLLVVLICLGLYCMKRSRKKESLIRGQPRLVFKDEGIYETVDYPTNDGKVDSNAGHYSLASDEKTKCNNTYLTSRNDYELPGNNLPQDTSSREYVIANDASIKNSQTQDPYVVPNDANPPIAQEKPTKNEDGSSPYKMADTAPNSDNPYELPIPQAKDEYLSFA